MEQNNLPTSGAGKCQSILQTQQTLSKQVIELYKCYNQACYKFCKCISFVNSCIINTINS